jgi:hypothetical protein
MKVNSFGVDLKQFAPPLFAKRKEKLYILFIPTSYPSTIPETFFARAEENIRDSFYAYRGGVIGALKKAIASTGYLLHSRQVQGAIFCLAEGKKEAYLAIAGPITAVWQQRGQVKSLVGSPPALGESPEPKPHFSSLPLESGNILLIAPAGDELTLRQLEKTIKSGKGEEVLAALQETLGPKSWGVTLEPTPLPSPEPLGKRLRALGELARKLLAPTEKPEKKPTPSPNHWAKAAALAIPLIVLFLILLAYFQRARVLDSRMNHLLQEAKAAISIASSAPDEQTQREALKRASQAIEEARLLRPMAPQLKEVEKTFQEQYDKTYKVLRNYPIATLTHFREPGAEPRRLVVDGRDIYVLDSGTDKLYLYKLNEVGDALVDPDKPAVLLQKGQAVEDVVVKELVEMAFYSTPQPEAEKGILVLDSSANLYRLSLPWGAPRHWSLASNFSYPDRMKTLDKRLYILDRGQGQIWRYMPGEGGYPSPPTPYFPRAMRMDGVRDFALDGYVYLLLADGRILKFLAGNLVPFELEPLDKPFLNPSALFTFPEEDLEKPKFPLYVADPSQRRIVELDKNGKLRRQFALPEGEEAWEILDFAVDERGKSAFVLTPKSLLLLFFP